MNYDVTFFKYGKEQTQKVIAQFKNREDAFLFADTWNYTNKSNSSFVLVLDAGTNTRTER